MIEDVRRVVCLAELCDAVDLVGYPGRKAAGGGNDGQYAITVGCGECVFQGDEVRDDLISVNGGGNDDAFESGGLNGFETGFLVDPTP